MFSEPAVQMHTSRHVEHRLPSNRVLQLQARIFGWHIYVAGSFLLENDFFRPAVEWLCEMCLCSSQFVELETKSEQNRVDLFVKRQQHLKKYAQKNTVLSTDI